MPFQFTIRQLLLLTVICSVGLALLFHWGVPGFALLYVVASGSAIGFGLYRGEAILAVLGGSLLLIGTCFGLEILSGVGHGHTARRANCVNNLRNVTLALIQYHDTFQSFPPPYIADANGKPMHSWRVLILPYLDQKSLYRSYRFDEPWDGPNNRKLHNIGLKIFECPSHGKTQPNVETSYVAVVGSKTLWPEASSYTIRMADVTDGSSNTVVLVEVANSGIHWMEPRDLHVVQMPMTINPKSGQGISSNHKGGANVSFVDGSVRFLTDVTPPETLRAILTRNGKERVTIP